MINRQIFSERLKQVLNDADMPRSEDERADAFSKIFDLNPIVAERIIDGLSSPSEDLISDIAAEFEVPPKWLSGEEEDSA